MHWLTINHFPISQEKNRQEVYEKLIEMSRNGDYSTGNLLDLLDKQRNLALKLDKKAKQLPQKLYFH